MSDRVYPPCLLNGLYGCVRPAGHRRSCEPPVLSASTTLCLSDFAYRRSWRHVGKERYWFLSPMNAWYFDGVRAAARAWSAAQPPRGGWQHLRAMVFESHGEICSYCGEVGAGGRGPDGRAWQVDHVIPVARGGRDELNNLVLACATCNARKGIKPWQPRFGPLAVAR